MMTTKTTMILMMMMTMTTTMMMVVIVVSSTAKYTNELDKCGQNVAQKHFDVIVKYVRGNLHCYSIV